jgi:hypothetical protein
MNKYTIDYKGFTFERVDKRTAKRAYINGLTVIICPCNLRPFSMYHPEFYFNRKIRENFYNDEIGVKNDFENYLNSFAYYNYTNGETGKYPAFYIPVEWVDRFTGEKSTSFNSIKQYAYGFMEA